MSANANPTGRPAKPIDMARVLSLLPALSVREIGKLIGVHHNTLSYRLRTREPKFNVNPFCVTCRVRMYARTSRTKSKGMRTHFYCRNCSCSTFHPKRPVRHGMKGRPPVRIDYATVSELIKSRSVADVAAEIGIHRNTIYRYIGLGMIAARPFRTWILGSSAVVKRSARTGEVRLAYWPYMADSDPRYTGLIRAVNEAVPRTLADSIRADVCQEIMVSVLTGEIAETEIAGAVSAHLRKHYKQFPVKAYGVLSLDAPIYSDRDLRLGDTLDAERVAERIRDGLEANRFTQDTPRSYKHVSRLPRRVVEPNILPREYDRLRRTYQFLRSGRVIKNAFQEPERFAGSWTVETALPEEIERLELAG